MDEKKLQQEILKDKVKIILSSIAEAILMIMELYIMINYKSNFIALAIIVVMMIVGLFFLISGILDITLKNKEIDEKKYEDLYNAQKASYVVIRKSFDELENRLRNIEANSSLPAEEIINAQKAVAKVTISRSKENTDALMNSNDELINQLFSIQEKIDDNNSALLDTQQKLLNDTKAELQRKIDELSRKLSNVENSASPSINYTSQPEPIYEQPSIDEPSYEEQVAEETIIEESFEEPVAQDIEFEEAIEEPLFEEKPIEDEIIEEIEQESPVDEVSDIIDEATDDVSIDNLLEEPSVEEIIADSEPEPEEEDSFDIDQMSLEEPLFEPNNIELPLDTDTNDDIILDDVINIDEPTEEQANVEDINLDSLLNDIDLGEPLEPEPTIDLEPISIPEPEPIQEPEPEAEPEPVVETKVEIPDVGIDLSDPNRVMSPEEIEKLFASI